MAGNITSNISDTPMWCIHTIDPYNPIRPDSVNPTWTFLAIVNGLFALPTAGVNALIVWTVFSDEDLRSSPFNVLLGELAVTDMLVGLVVQPMCSAILGCLINYCYSPCQVTALFIALVLCNGCTLVTLALACAERYLSIEHPNLYNRIVTGERSQKVAVISWILTAVYLITSSIFLNNAHPDLSKGPLMALVTVCAGTIFFCCTKVQLTAYRQKRFVAIQQQVPISQNAMQPEEQVRLRMEMKQACTVTILVIMSVLFITPVIVISALELTTNQGAKFKFLAAPISFLFFNLQSLVNPTILALRLTYIRKGTKNKLVFLRSLFPFGQ